MGMWTKLEWILKSMMRSFLFLLTERDDIKTLVIIDNVFLTFGYNLLVLKSFTHNFH